jgi:hypothetical protein
MPATFGRRSLTVCNPPDSVHTRLDTIQHLDGQKAHVEGTLHPAPRCGPKCVAAGWAAKALIASARCSLRESPRTPPTARGRNRPPTALRGSVQLSSR